MSEVPSASPGYAETSVRWLRSHYAIFVPTTSTRSFHAVLADALIRMKFRHEDMVKRRHFPDSKWRSSLKQLAAEWGKTHHDQMVMFLHAVGLPPKKGDAEKVMIPVTDAAGKVIDHETLELELDELEAATPGPKSQLSPDHELDEVVADAAKKADMRFGVW